MWLVAQFSSLDAADEEKMSPQLSNALGATLGSYELIPGEFSDEDAPLNHKGRPGQAVDHITMGGGVRGGIAMCPRRHSGLLQPNVC